MLIGENRRFMSALITLKTEMDMKTGLPSQDLLPETKEFLKKTLKIEAKDANEAIKNEKLVNYIH